MSPDASSSWFSTTVHSFFSRSASALKVSFCSSCSRSEVAMYRKSLSLLAIFSMMTTSAVFAIFRRHVYP